MMSLRGSLFASGPGQNEPAELEWVFRLREAPIPRKSLSAIRRRISKALSSQGHLPTAVKSISGRDRSTSKTTHAAKNHPSGHA